MQDVVVVCHPYGRG